MAVSRLKFSPRTTLITGASAGIGAAFAHLLAERGDRLILTARRADRLQALADTLKRQHNTECTIIPLDLGTPGATTQLFAQTEALGLTVDILINNAGFGKYGAFGNHPIADYQQVIGLNITALTDLCYLYLPGMRQRQRGGILNVASLAAFTPTPLLSVYGATKAYVLSLSQALAAEVADDQVQISALCPGSTATEFASVAASSTEPATSNARLGVLSAEAVAKLGLDGFEAGKAIIVTGWMNKMIAVSTTLIPRGVMRRSSKMIFSRMAFFTRAKTSHKPDPAH